MSTFAGTKIIEEQERPRAARRYQKARAVEEASAKSANTPKK
jgi:hypothetical protein